MGLLQSTFQKTRKPENQDQERHQQFQLHHSILNTQKTWQTQLKMEVSSSYISFPDHQTPAPVLSLPLSQVTRLKTMSLHSWQLLYTFSLQNGPLNSLFWAQFSQIFCGYFFFLSEVLENLQIPRCRISADGDKLQVGHLTSVLKHMFGTHTGPPSSTSYIN